MINSKVFYFLVFLYSEFFVLKLSITISDYDQLAKDFTRVFLNTEPSCLQNAHLFDVVFLVGQTKQKARFIGVRAILGVRSRVFQVSTTLPFIVYINNNFIHL